MSVRIVVKRRGPLAIEGDLELVNPDGSRIETGGRTRILLCRCGASKEKPFCDGSHNRIGFGADEEKPSES